MDALPLGLAAPAIGSVLGSVGRVASAVRAPFSAVLNSASQKTPGENTSVESAPAAHQDRVTPLQRNLEQRILKALQDADIEIQGPIELQISKFDGSLEVSNEHPLRAVIEAALATDTTIADDFRRLSTIHRLLNAGGATEINAQNTTGKALLEITSSPDRLQLRYA